MRGKKIGNLEDEVLVNFTRKVYVNFKGDKKMEI